MKQKQFLLSLAVLSGVMNAVSFPPFNLGFIAWLSFVPFFILAKSSPDPKKAFFYSFISGFVFYIILGYWLFQVTVPGSILIAIYLSLFFAGFGVVSWFIINRSMEVLLIPFIWVVLEFLRCNIFTGYPWGLFGYTQYKTIDLIQIADITGVYGISFALMMFNVAVYSYFARMKKRFIFLAFSIFIISFALMYSKEKLDTPEIWGTTSISVLQGNIPQSFKADPDQSEFIIEEYVGLTREAAKDSPDIIIWPETSYPYLVTDESEPEELKNLAKEIGIPLLVGAVYAYGDEYCNSALMISKEGKIKEIYNKTHLVPFGEYVPLERYFRNFRSLIDKPIGIFVPGNEYTTFPLNPSFSFVGDKGEIRAVKKFFKFGVLICFEDCFSYITREFVKRGASLMVNITNDAWFGRSAAPEQHLQASVFRAVENRVPVVRAANTGISAFVDASGKIYSRVETNEEDVFVKGFDTQKVRVFGTKSFYTINGDMFVYFCSVMVILVFMTEFFLAKQEKKSG